MFYTTHSAFGFDTEYVEHAITLNRSFCTSTTSILQIDEDNPAVLYVGARPPRHYRFSGEIENIVVIPNEFFSEEEAEMYHSDIGGLIAPTGTCVNYLQEDEECPAPAQPQSLLCTSVFAQ